MDDRWQNVSQVSQKFLWNEITTKKIKKNKKSMEGKKNNNKKLDKKDQFEKKEQFKHPLTLKSFFQGTLTNLCHRVTHWIGSN